MRSGSAAVPRRRGPYEAGRSRTGLALTGAGAVAGAVLSVAALAVGLFALAYADGSVRFGGDAYGCGDSTCAAGHTLAGVLCFASIALWLGLGLLALPSSIRTLRYGMRLAVAWAAVIVGVSVLADATIGWLWLAVLAVPPLLMGGGARLRLRAKERQLRQR